MADYISSIRSRVNQGLGILRAAAKALDKMPDSPILQAEATKATPPEIGEIATFSLKDPLVQNPSQVLTLSAWNAAKTNANNGDPREQCRIAELVKEIDAQVASAYQTRALGITRRSWAIVDPSFVGKGENPVVTECEKLLQSLPNVERKFLTTWNGEWSGVSLQELIWSEPDDSGKQTIIDIVERHPGRIRFNRKNEAYCVDHPLIVTDKTPTGEPLEPGKWILHTPAIEFMKTRGAIIRRVAEAAIIKRTMLADQCSYIEKFGHPPIYGIISQDAYRDTALVNSVKTGIAGISHASTGVLPDSVTLKLVEPSNGGDTAFSAAMEYQNQQITKAILGHTGSTDSTANALGGSDDSTDIRQLILEADARSIESTWRDQVLKPFILANTGAGRLFPEGQAIPYLHFDIDGSEDQKIRSEVDAQLVAMGWVPTEKYITETYGRPIAAKNDKVLTPVSAGVAPSLGIALQQPQEAPTAVATAPVAPSPGVAQEAVAVAKDPTTALNGAQVTSLLSIIEMVTLGTLPRDTAVNLINAAFPISVEQADKILGSVGQGFVATVKEPATTAPVPTSFSQGKVTRAIPLPNQNAQGYTEELIRQALSEALPMWQMYLAPVSEAIQSATSYEDLQARLGKVGLKSKEIGDLLARCKLTGQMIGRLEIQAGLGMSLGEMPPISEIKPLKPTEAVEWFDKRLDMSNDQYKEMDDKTRMAAFSLAEEQDTEVIRKIRSKIQTAMDNGDSLESFQVSLADLDGTDIGLAHSELIFRNAINKSISAGRFKQQTDPAVIKLRPYLQYRATHDNRTRSNHAALDGKVFAADDPFWSTHYPPNGHNCRCTVVSLSDRQLAKLGLAVSETAPEDGSPDDGWSANAGELE